MFGSLATDVVSSIRAAPSGPETETWRALAGQPHALSREGWPGHFTASVLPISPDGSRVCLVHHARMQLWVQPGGHFEAGDASVGEAAARELAEETGLWAAPQPAPLRLSRHPAPCRPGAWHHDFQLVAVVAEEAVTVSDESDQVAWFPVWDLPGGLAPGVAGLVARAVSRTAPRGCRPPDP